MKNSPFLKEISETIVKTYGNNLADIAVIFPNKRASLWMNDYLAEAASAPVFAPKYFSIQELFQKHSRLVLADHIQLVSILHATYCKITGEQETLDHFYPWGEILLSDFDNVDKSLADPVQVFRNISNLHEMDTIAYLNDQQKALLERFFQTFTRNHESRLQQKFIALWNNLTDIYNTFKATLRAGSLAYEGMLFRDVVENVSSEDFTHRHYFAVGFNQLSKCEQKLLFLLAGKLMVKNDDASIKTVNSEAKITIAQSLTDDLQARYIENWLLENGRLAADRKTAIVLCDEHLLPSAIYHLPAVSSQVSYNITAGFPLAETPPATYVAEHLEKQGLEAMLSYITTIEGAANSGGLSPMMQEAQFRVYNILTRLKTLKEQGYLKVTQETLARLYRQIVQTATIPFHGEPAKGVQMMGVLETRNLDFDHILMLSCNEGVMPQGADDTSVIPYAIKKAFELNTSDDRTSIFAYYFYRLLKRCKDVTLVYNASNSDTNPGEMSRFLLSLVVNIPEQIQRIALQSHFDARTLQPQPQEKTAADLHRYMQRTSLSPTAINTYMRCEKSFYYKYFCGLQEDKEEEDTLDAAAFGSFFHNAAEDFYRKFIGERIAASLLQPYIDKPALLEPHVNRALEKTKKELYGENSSMESGGMEQLLKSIVRKYLHRMLVNDQKFAPFTVLSLENKYYKPYTVSTPEGELTLNIGGAVDRLDQITDEEGRTIVRIVDYKTGADHGKVKVDTVADIFSNTKEGSGYYRQTILYGLAVMHESQASHEEGQGVSPQLDVNKSSVSPALYYIRNKAIGTDEPYDPTLKLAGKPIKDIAEIQEDYEAELKKVLHDIFNKTVFSIPQDLSICTNCPFAELCHS